MKRIEISTNMLENSISAVSSNLEGVLSTIEKTYEGICVLNVMWEGPANVVFNRQFLTDYNRLKEICCELHNFASRLTEAKNKYEQAEANVGAAVESINF